MTVKDDKEQPLNYGLHSYHTVNASGRIYLFSFTDAISQGKNDQSFSVYNYTPSHEKIVVLGT